MVSATALLGSPHHVATVGSLKISISVASSPACTGRRTTRLPRSSGGEVDSNRTQAFVQRIKGELDDLALGVAELSDIARVARIDNAGDQGHALDESLVVKRRLEL